MFARIFDYPHQALVRKVVINNDVMTFYLRNDAHEISINEFDVFMQYLKKKGYSFITEELQWHLHKHDIHCCDENIKEHNHFHLKAKQTIDQKELKNILTEIEQYQNNSPLREKLFNEKNGVSIIDTIMSFLGFNKNRWFTIKILNGNQIRAITEEFNLYSSKEIIPEDNTCKVDAINSFSKINTNLALRSNLPILSQSSSTLALPNPINDPAEEAMTKITLGVLIVLTGIWLWRSANKSEPKTEQQSATRTQQTSFKNN